MSRKISKPFIYQEKHTNYHIKWTKSIFQGKWTKPILLYFPREINQMYIGQICKGKLFLVLHKKSAFIKDFHNLRTVKLVSLEENGPNVYFSKKNYQMRIFQGKCIKCTSLGTIYPITSESLTRGSQSKRIK